MSTAAETATNAPALSAEDKAKAIAALPDMVRAGIEKLNAEIKNHNLDVALIKAASADKEDPRKFGEELVRAHAGDDPELKKILDLIEKLQSQVETYWGKAIEKAQKFMPEKVTEDQIKAAQARTKESSSSIRTQKAAFSALTALMGQDLTVYLDDMQTTRGVRTGISVPGQTTGVKRPRYSKLFFANPENPEEFILSAVDKEVDGTIVKNSMPTILARDITKMLPSGTSVRAPELQVAFLAHLKEMDSSYGDNGYEKLTAGQEVVWTYHVPIKDSDGKQIDEKHFKLKFVK